MLKIAWTPHYHHPLPEGHRFPMEKYTLLPQQLLYEGTCREEHFFAPTRVAETDVMAVHSPVYWNKVKSLQLSPQQVRRTGFPLSHSLVEREKVITQGTLMAADFALQFGISMNIAGGTHHAFSDRGEGFCLLNDMAVAAFYLLKQQKVQQVLIIDLDVHQGNGTASIFREIPQVFTFSMHGAHNYPLHKEHSDLDIPLEDHTDDKTYLSLLMYTLPNLFERYQPDFVFYQAGVDVLETDKLGRLALTRQGCKERDRFVLQTCARHKVPLVVSMGGGYSPQIAHIIEAHANTFRLAQEIFF
jgi:acetoin utilization deacetylase AcuC-like enzyme